MNSFTFAFGADHAAVALKHELAEHLRSLGHTVKDFGTEGTASVDYPDYAQVVCQEVLKGGADYGILLCGSGIGMSLAANRFKGIRAALIHNTEYAELAKQHNRANVLCMGARFTAPFHAKMMLDAFLAAHFEEGNHTRRIGKLDADHFC